MISTFEDDMEDLNLHEDEDRFAYFQNTPMPTPNYRFQAGYNMPQSVEDPTVT